MAPHIPGNRLPSSTRRPKTCLGNPCWRTLPDIFSTFLQVHTGRRIRWDRPNTTAEGTTSDAQALELVRAVPDPLRDAASDEEGPRHGHFGQALAPEEIWGTPELFGELDNSALSDTMRIFSGYKDPSGENLLEGAPRFAELFADELELFGGDDVDMDPPPVPPLFNGQRSSDGEPSACISVRPL